jgi:hypothetical protein
MKLSYAAWTYKDVKARVIEMAETLLRLPPVRGPRMFGNGMPETVREKWKDAAPSNARVRLLPSAGAIARMEECSDWINTYLDMGGRNLLYDYGFTKTRRGMYLDDYLERNEIARRTFERQIQRHCQAIADNLNRKLSVRFTMPVDVVSQITVEHASTTVSSEKCATHWRASDAKPQIDPDLPTERLIDPRSIRVRHSDKNRSLGAR